MARLILWWPREGMTDWGREVSPREIPVPVRARVMDLAAGDERAIDVRLPFASRHRLTTLPLEREGTVIRSVVSPMDEAIDLAAVQAFSNPVWQRIAEGAREAEFMRTALRRWFREAAVEMYFRDLARLALRRHVAAMLAYGACSFPRHDAPRVVIKHLQQRLAVYEARLREAGRGDLARRFEPRWAEDIRREASPEVMEAALRRESMAVDALAEVVTSGTASSVKTFGRQAEVALRGFPARLRHLAIHCDLRPLAPGLVREAMRVLGG